MKLDILRHGDIVGIKDALNQCAEEYKYEVRYMGHGTYGFFGIEPWMFEESQLKYWGKYADGFWFPWGKWKVSEDLDRLWRQDKPKDIFYKWRLIKKQEEKQMNKIIIEMFPVTKEAVLVDKWFGREIDKPIFKMLISGKEKELLSESQRLEAEEQNKK